MQNIIIVNGVRQSGVTTKCKEIKKQIEDMGLGYKIAMIKKDGKFDIDTKSGEFIIDRGIIYDFIIMERCKMRI